MKAVLGRCSGPKTVRFSAMCFAVAALAFAFVVYAPPSPTYGLLFHAPVFVGGSLMVFSGGVMVHQLMFDDKSAVWIDNNRIVYLNRWYQSVDAANVIKISTSAYGLLRLPTLVFDLRNGGRKLIQANLLSEPVEEVAARLRASLGQSRTLGPTETNRCSS